MKQYNKNIKYILRILLITFLIIPIITYSQIVNSPFVPAGKDAGGNTLVRCIVGLNCKFVNVIGTSSAPAPDLELRSNPDSVWTLSSWNNAIVNNIINPLKNVFGGVAGLDNFGKISTTTLPISTSTGNIISITNNGLYASSSPVIGSATNTLLSNNANNSLTLSDTNGNSTSTVVQVGEVYRKSTSTISIPLSYSLGGSVYSVTSRTFDIVGGINGSKNTYTQNITATLNSNVFTITGTLPSTMVAGNYIEINNTAPIYKIVSISGNNVTVNRNYTGATQTFSNYEVFTGTIQTGAYTISDANTYRTQMAQALIDTWTSLNRNYNLSFTAPTGFSTTINGSYNATNSVPINPIGEIYVVDITAGLTASDANFLLYNQNQNNPSVWSPAYSVNLVAKDIIDTEIENQILAGNNITISQDRITKKIYISSFSSSTGGIIYGLPLDVIGWTNDSGVAYVSNSSVSTFDATTTAPASPYISGSQWTFDAGTTFPAGFTDGSEVLGTDASGRTVSGVLTIGSPSYIQQTRPDRIAGGGFTANTTYNMKWRVGITASAALWSDNGTAGSGNFKINTLSPGNNITLTPDNINPGRYVISSNGGNATNTINDSEITLYSSNPVKPNSPASGTDFIISNGSIVLATTSGNTWNQTSQTTGNFYSLLNTGTQLLAGGINGDGIYKSLDGGNTWTQTSQTTGNFYSLLNTGTQLLAGNGTGIYKSTDGGNTWTQTSQTTGNFYSLLNTGSQIIAGSGAGIYKSIDGGNTWSQTSQTTFSFPSLLNTGTQLIAGSGSNAGIYKSLDGGNTWTQTSQTTGYFYSFLNTGSQILAGSSAGIYKSIDGGNTWSQTSQTTANFYSLLNTGYQLIAGSIAGIYKSTDGGNTWSQTSQTTGIFYSLLNTGSQILAGSSAGIYKSPIQKWYSNPIGTPALWKSTIRFTSATNSTYNTIISDVFNYNPTSGNVNGTGTAGYVSVWNGTNTIGTTTLLYQNNNLTNNGTTTLNGNVYLTQSNFKATSSILGNTGTTPRQLTIDSAGNIYTANYDGNNVTKITPAGATSTLGTTGVNPFGIAVDTAGNVYTANSAGGSITKITPAGTSSVFATGLYYPWGMTIDSNNNLYVTSYFGNNVYKITSTGTITTLGTTGANPYNVIVGNDGYIYTTNFGSSSVSKINPTTGTSSILGNTGSLPYGLVMDASDNIYTANDGSGNITKITPAGISTTFAVTGGKPRGIVLDGKGKLYVTETQADLIIIVDIATGQSSTLISATGTVIDPFGLVIDTNTGTLYSGNAGSNNVSKITQPYFNKSLTLDNAGNVILGATSNGVNSINNIQGDVNLNAGTGIGINNSGKNITITNTGSGTPGSGNAIDFTLNQWGEEALNVPSSERAYIKMGFTNSTEIGTGGSLAGVTYWDTSRTAPVGGGIGIRQQVATQFTNISLVVYTPAYTVNFTTPAGAVASNFALDKLLLSKRSASSTSEPYLNSNLFPTFRDTPGASDDVQMIPVVKPTITITGTAPNFTATISSGVWRSSFQNYNWNLSDTNVEYVPYLGIYETSGVTYPPTITSITRNSGLGGIQVLSSIPGTGGATPSISQVVTVGNSLNSGQSISFPSVSAIQIADGTAGQVLVKGAGNSVTWGSGGSGSSPIRYSDMITTAIFATNTVSVATSTTLSFVTATTTPGTITQWSLQVSGVTGTYYRFVPQIQNTFETASFDSYWTTWNSATKTLSGLVARKGIINN